MLNGKKNNHGLDEPVAKKRKLKLFAVCWAF